MSSDCGNCDCADKSQCTKKRSNGFQGDGIVETSYNMGQEMIVDQGENDCKCGPGCACGSCHCHK